jgi:bacillithiol biosynthesis cysteine-adding enzyme BshC
MKIILNRRLYNSFYQDYILQKSAAHQFIDSPHQLSWDELIPRLNLHSERYQYTRTVLINQNRDLQSPKAKIYLDYLQSPESVIIITGQQLGLFASPLYTIYKIASTIKLTESLNSKRQKYKFVPVFWLETEDHDFQEVNHIGVQDKNFVPKHYVYDGEDKGKVSLRHYRLESSVSSFLDEVKDNLLDTEFSDDLFKKLHKYYKPGKEWTMAIRDFLIELFYPYGLLFFQPGAREIKELSVDFFIQFLSKGEMLSHAFEQKSGQLMSAGYHNQVKYIDGQTFVHIEQEHKQREHLYLSDESYYFKKSTQKYHLQEIIEKIKENPSAVSSTVASRPLLQSWLLPVAAYIAGPGEIAYWAQLSQMFKEMDLVIPVLYPRISATLIEPKVARYMKKYSPDLEEMPLNSNLFIDEYFKQLNEDTGQNPLRNLDQMLIEESGKVEAYIKAVDPTLIDMTNKSLDRMRQTISNLESRLLKAQEQKQSQLTNHLQQLHASIFPDGVPQERFQSIIYFLNKFGPEILERIVMEPEINTFDHQFLYL